MIEVTRGRFQSRHVTILLELTLRLLTAYVHREAIFVHRTDLILSPLIGIGAQSGSTEVSRRIVCHRDLLPQLSSIEALPGRACDCLIALLKLSLICRLHLLFGVAELKNLIYLT